MRVPASVRSIVGAVVARAVEGTVSDVIRGKPGGKGVGRIGCNQGRWQWCEMFGAEMW
jgi:hypothetical protein